MSTEDSDYKQGKSFHPSKLFIFDGEKNVSLSSNAQIPPQLTTCFVRGVVESSLCFEDSDIVVFSVVVRISSLIEKWITLKGIKLIKTTTTPHLQFYKVQGTESLDLLSILYDGSHPSNRNEKKYKRYVQMAGILKSVLGCEDKSYEEYQLPLFRVVRTDPRAVLPSKKRASDVGYDLTIISQVKNWGKRTALYDTGLIIQPPLGYYIEVVPRSSLSKSGYVQSNSMGIIDPNYLDTLKVPLTRVDDSMPELQLPFTGFQLILRRAIHGVMVECTRDQLVDTSRGTGGFGSTGDLNRYVQLSPPPVLSTLDKVKSDTINLPFE